MAIVFAKVKNLTFFEKESIKWILVFIVAVTTSPVYKLLLEIIKAIRKYHQILCFRISYTTNFLLPFGNLNRRLL